MTVVDGGMLGQQFMHNAGAPYKFVIQTSTQPFDEVAPVINQVLELLKERVRMVIPGYDSNELLTVAYMEGQRMEVFPSRDLSNIPVFNN